MIVTMLPLAVLALFFISLYFIYHHFIAPWLALAHIPTLTFNDVNTRDRYLYEYGDLIRKGYYEYTKSGIIFKVKSSFNTWRVVIPPESMKEIKNAAGNTLSWQKATHDILMIRYTGVPDRAPWSARALRVNVTKSLDLLVPLMIDEINDFFDKKFPDQDGVWHEVNCIHAMFCQSIARITNLVFFGPELARDSEWVQATLDITKDSWAAASQIRKYPWWSQWWYSFIQPISGILQVRKDNAYMHKRLEPLFRERMQRLRAGGGEKTDDAFQWLLEAGGPDVSLTDFADTMSRIMMASIHTTTNASTFALAELLTRPEYLPDIRKEMADLFENMGGEPSRNDIEGLRRMDSFIKETARHSPIGIRRKVQGTTHTFSNGVSIPNGIIIYLPALAILQDSEYYDSPEDFNGNRFYDMRQVSSAEDKRWQFANATLESPNFGYGVQACPGRWFATQEMLLLFSKLCLDYDIEAVDMKGPPKAVYVDTSLQPPVGLKMKIRKKTKSTSTRPRMPINYADFPFVIKEHITTASHLREYPHAVIDDGCELKLSVKQYIPRSNPEPSVGDITLIVSPGIGYAKELYEPLYEDILTRSARDGFKIRSIWAADPVHEGQSAALNADKLGNEVFWFDHSRDLLIDSAYLSILHPRLLTSLILIEPAISQGWPAKVLFPQFCSIVKRREVFPSMDAASSYIATAKCYSTWDPRTIARLQQYGFVPVYPKCPNKKEVRMSTPKAVEAASFFRSNVRQVGRDGLENITEEDRLEVPDIDPDAYWMAPIYRPETDLMWKLLPTLRPWVMYIVGESTVYAVPNAVNERTARTGTGIGGSGGPKSGGSICKFIDGGGHSMPMDGHVGIVAKEIGVWIGKEKARWEEKILKKEKEWQEKSVEARQRIEEGLKTVAETYPEKKKAGRIMTNPRRGLEKL
ncbi:hypothetical protein B7494_g3710 [Chlorociboria aeruginascens]|nr:hypothetical protein B7494_g3710 [Chlorociboria aeruginascens]